MSLEEGCVAWTMKQEMLTGAICHAMQVLQIFLPIIKVSPVANIVTSKLAPNVGQLLTAVQNVLAGI
jgi:hypothetical protein